MTGRDIAFSLKDILDEYRILEDTPLKAVRLVTISNDAILIYPVVELHMVDGTIFELRIAKK